MAEVSIAGWLHRRRSRKTPPAVGQEWWQRNPLSGEWEVLEVTDIRDFGEGEGMSVHIEHNGWGSSSSWWDSEQGFERRKKHMVLRREGEYGGPAR